MGSTNLSEILFELTEWYCFKTTFLLFAMPIFNFSTNFLCNFSFSIIKNYRFTRCHSCWNSRRCSQEIHYMAIMQSIKIFAFCRFVASRCQAIKYFIEFWLSYQSVRFRFVSFDCWDAGTCPGADRLCGHPLVSCPGNFVRFNKVYSWCGYLGCRRHIRYVS